MKGRVVWIRMGDAGEYQDCSDTYEVASLFLEYGVRQVWYVGKMGLGAVGYEGQNYISAYWGQPGDAGGGPVSGLKKSEVADINKALAKESGGL